jgi:hypothetical protein
MVATKVRYMKMPFWRFFILHVSKVMIRGMVWWDHLPGWALITWSHVLIE